MDFEQYLEKDIITFLDGKIEKKENVLIDREEEYGIYMAKDYLKELSYALDNEELTKAKRLFDDLKLRFSTLPKNSLERKKVYSLLEKMYAKIQNYVKIKEGKIEVIKQGDSEVFKDTTEKFADIAGKIAVNKVQVSAELTKEFEDEGHAELPIRSDKDKKDKEHLKTESSDEKKKKHEFDKIVVEPKIPEKHIEKHDKEHEKHVSDLKPKEDIHRVYSGIETSLANEIVHVAERLLNELNKKREEKDIESIREEISKEVIKELDKRFDAEKKIFSNEKKKLSKEILDKVYDKAKQIISDDDNKLNNPDTKITKDTDSKAKYIIEHVSKKEEDNLIYTNTQIKNIADNQEIDTNEKSDLNENLTRNSSNVINLHDPRLKDGHSEENMNRMYEEAIYTMFQNDYTKAAKIFEKILRIRPENKAAKIRLSECTEAIGNA